MTMQGYAFLGQFISGISFAVTALTAASTYFLYHRKQLDDAWLDRFRSLYHEFWNDEQMVMARHLINNAPGYNQLEEILIRRNSVKDCDVELADYKKLELIDNFCSVLVRVRSFGQSIDMTETQEEIWGDLLYNFWMKKIREKQLLKEYINNHWGKLLEPIKVKRRKKYIIL